MSRSGRAENSAAEALAGAGARRALGAAVLLLAAVSPTAGCGPRAWAGDDAALEIRVEIRAASGEVRRTFDAGEPITLELVVHNGAEQPRSVTLPSTQTHDFAVEDAQKTRVWRASHGRYFAQMLTSLTFGAGETRRFSSEWDQRRADGSAAPPGEYRVVGTLTSMPPRAAASPASLTIR